MNRPHPAPIIPLSNRLLLAIDDVVASFPNKRRKTGDRIYEAAEQCALLAQQAWHAGGRRKHEQADLLLQLSILNDTLKLRLQVAYRLQCFRSSGQFKEIATLARDVGRQAGAWKRDIDKHLNGQNSPPSAPVERPETLSTRATCMQVTR